VEIIITMAIVAAVLCGLAETIGQHRRKGK
jgi:hypothetical protein